METKNYRIGNKVQVSLFKNEKDFRYNVRDTYINDEWFIGEIQSIEPFNPDYTYNIDLDTNEKHANNIDEWQRVDPIPLTKEWLMKFGFEVEFSKKQGLAFNEQDVKFQIESSDLEWFKLSKYNNGQTYFKYVHELQNLYFSLTGKELVFSEAQRLTCMVRSGYMHRLLNKKQN